MTKLIVLGAGGYARVLIDLLREQSSITLLGLVGIQEEEVGTEMLGVQVIGTENILSHYATDTIKLVNALGSVDLPLGREKVFTRFKNRGFEFYSVIHHTAFISRDCVMAEGVQIMAGTIVQTGCRLGQNSLLNTGVIIDHDCQVGQHSHIASGATLSGHVQIGEQVHIGTGSVIKQGIHVGDQALIGAGSVVIRNVLAQQRVAGVPAKEIHSIKEEINREELERHHH